MEGTSRSLLRTAAAYQHIFDVVIAADEICSRCRVYSLCREIGVSLKLFKVRRLSDVDQSNATLVTFGTVVPDERFLAPPLVFERDGAPLLRLMDRVI